MRRPCCDEFSRSRVAGEGLRAIEPGMPLPAGTGMTRRSFVARSLGLALTVYGVGRLGLFDGASPRQQRRRAGKILVSVFLPGGADGMSMLYPAADPALQEAAPEPRAHRRPAQFTEDTRLAWHPALAPLAQLHAEGKVTVMPAIGYTHPDQSHFTSRHYWEVGATDHGPPHRLARPLPRRGRHRRQSAPGALADRAARAVARDRAGARSPRSTGPTSTRFYAAGVWNDVQNRMLEAMGEFGDIHTTDPALRTAADVAQQAERLRMSAAPVRRQEDAQLARHLPRERDRPASRSGSPGSRP